MNERLIYCKNYSILWTRNRVDEFSRGELVLSAHAKNVAQEGIRVFIETYNDESLSVDDIKQLLEDIAK